MTKKLVTIITAGLILMAANFNGNAEAATPPGRDMMKHARFGIRMAERNLLPAHMLLRFKDEIGLTQNQVDRIEKMQEQFEEYAIKQKAELKIKEMKIHSYLKKDKIDRKRMEKMIREVTNMKTDMQIAHMNYLLDLKELLTPEQLQKIERFRKERRLRWLKEREHRMRDREHRFKKSAKRFEGKGEGEG
jgi:Spy/CpxP family protein refolding chaperone